MEAETRHNPDMHLTEQFDKRRLKREYPADSPDSSHGPTLTAGMKRTPSSPHESSPPHKYRYPPSYGRDKASYPPPPSSASFDTYSHHSDDRNTYRATHTPPPPPRQSLPSIYEALGSDQPMSHFNSTQAPAQANYGTSTPPASRLDLSRSLLSDGPPRDSYAADRPIPRSPPKGHAAPHPPTSHPQSAQDASRNSSFSDTRLPGVQYLTEPHSPPHTAGRNFGQSAPLARSPEYTKPVPTSNTLYQSYSHTTYTSQPTYGSLPAESSIPPSAPAPQPNGHFTPQNRPSYNGSPTDNPAEVSKPIPKPAYGESVKRHLDVFDLESSLNEISESSKHLYDFSMHYSHRAQQTHRSGPLPGSTPHLNEIDEMMKQGSRINDSLVRLRDVVLSQQAALAERSKDQAVKTVGGMNGHAGDETNSDSAKGGGFVGSDPKKRRGRAAPPGRCHSCNRAETPEWRRGPDGARTLCNACGLHYAKLTRKMGVNKASAIGSSNLRPKSLGPSQPA